MRRAYVVPTAFRPVEDEYFGVRTGLNYNFRDVGRITVAAYERRFHRTYAVADARFGGASYFDPGRVRIRGADLFYRLTLAYVEHYGGAEYREAELFDARYDRFPYLPSYEGSAGLTVRFGAGHSASGEVRFLGERYATPTAVEPLGAAWIPAANVIVRVRAGISVTAAAENFTDEPYYDAGGIAAPGRTFRLGMNLVL
jgi:outer membrane cobalamin receptor